MLLVSGYPLEGVTADAVAGGEFAFMAKPCRMAALAAWVAGARGGARPAERPREPDPYPEIVGESAAMRGVRAALARVGPAPASVLILGGTGTGKELVARAIHRTSPRHAGPFVAVNCGAVPATLFESEFFGHERGAFTDARERHPGLLEQAHRGTIFLDEIGDMPIEAQVKLLRAIERREVVRLGSATTVAVDIRVVAATSRDLQAEAAAGRFRLDLYYRLAVAVVRLPPLRERREDVALLANAWLGANAPDGGAPRTLSPEALVALAAHDWPGNVRELQHALWSASLQASGNVIGVGDLPPLAPRGGGGEPVDFSQFKRPPGASLLEAERAFLDRLERQWILEALETAHGNCTAAAQQLGINRRTLFEKMLRHGIARPSNEPLV